jgi:glycosyltransferase involved in cell wall biosynthesis
VISRFIELKGIQYIIPAFRKLLARYPDALILFFNARGGYESEIKRMLEAIPARNYRLIPFENELSAAYRLFDVYVQASIEAGAEAFGQTCVEALAAGVPSVFTLSGIAGDFIVDGENAVVASFKDSDALYRGMLKILDDDRLMERLRSSGPESVKEKFTVQAMINQLLSLYEAD